MTISKPPTAIVPADRSGRGDATLPLPDGRSVDLRSVVATDGIRTLGIPSAPSHRRTDLLFLSIAPELDHHAVDRMLQVDGHDRSAVVAVVGHELVGIGHLRRVPGTDRGRITVAVAAGLAGLGLERALHGALAARAHRQGLTTVEPSGGAP